MKVAVDAMGGDKAPEEVVKGALEYLEQGPAGVILVGDEAKITPMVEASPHYGKRLQVVHAPQSADGGGSPTEVVRRMKEASIVVAARLVKDGEAQALVSAGSTGVTMVAALRAFGRLKNIERPGIATAVPTLAGPCVVCDIGANVDCRPSHLVTFAHMGSIYAEKILGIRRPRVALLSNGEEEGKGNEVVVAAYAQLKESQLHFIGNIEGRDIFSGGADVVVCDGFVGNVVLKLTEGLAGAIMEMLGRSLNQSVRTRIGGALALPAFRRLKRAMDYTEYGGALLLGVNDVCVISHGASNAKAIRNAIRVAHEAVERQVTQTIAQISDERVVD